MNPSLGMNFLRRASAALRAPFSSSTSLLGDKSKPAEQRQIEYLTSHIQRLKEENDMLRKELQSKSQSSWKERWGLMTVQQTRYDETPAEQMERVLDKKISSAVKIYLSMWGILLFGEIIDSLRGK